MKTTLNAIRACGPCGSGWKNLLNGLGKTTADDDPLSLVTILDINGLDDALWCLRAVSGYDKEIRLFAVWCARQVQHLMTDKRSVSAIDVAERFANGDATKEELDAAWDAAWDAASSAASYAAWAAASSAASYADRGAAWAEACDADRDAQRTKFRELATSAQEES